MKYNVLLKGLFRQTIPNYSFPVIRHIEDIRPAIAGRSEFREKDCGDHIVVNYVVNLEDSFPHLNPGHFSNNDYTTILRRECRGIAFDKSTGLTIRRPPHKFFNLDERPETKIDSIDWIKSNFIILDKLDGSCISAYKDRNNRIIWGTPAGETDYTKYVENFVSENPQYGAAASYLIDLGWTPTFEFCSMVNHVVITHPVPRLILTCVRNVISGEYLPYHQMVALKDFGIEVVEKSNDVEWKGWRATIDHMIEQSKVITHKEGWVIRFDSGHMIKVKTDWYRELHGCVTEIRYEKDVLALILHNRLDDAMPFLSEVRAKQFSSYAQELHEGFMRNAKYIVDTVYYDRHLIKKQFTARHHSNQLFSFLAYGYDQKIYNMDYDDGVKFVYDYLRKYVGDRLSSQTWVDRLRYIYGNKRFEFKDG